MKRTQDLSARPNHRTIRWCAALASLAIALLAPTARADDWPQWRGPERDGVWHEKRIVESFPADGVKIVWHAALGPGFASPVIAAGRVFVTDVKREGKQARERVLCFDAASGKELWTFAYDVAYPEWAFTPGQSTGPCSTPLVADGKVFVLGGNGDVLCLAAATSEVAWRKDLSKEYEIGTLMCRASPLLDGDRLILCPGGKPGACVVALDRGTGRELWKALDEPMSNSSPIIVTAGGKRQLIVWTCESVTALDPATGAVFWREPMTTSNNDAIPTPVSAGDRLLVSGLMFKLDADKPAVSVLWPENRAAMKRTLSNTSTPMLAGDSVFSATSNGDFVCLDARTGAELWRTDKVTDKKVGASIHLTPNGGGAFLYTDRGELIRARLTPAGYEEISRARLLEPTQNYHGRKVAWAAPAYANRHVFARSEQEIVCGLLAAP